MEEYLAELQEHGLMKGPLQEEERGTWISNLMVITAKAWDKGQDRRTGDSV